MVRERRGGVNGRKGEGERDLETREEKLSYERKAQ